MFVVHSGVDVIYEGPCLIVHEPMPVPQPQIQPPMSPHPVVGNRAANHPYPYHGPVKKTEEMIKNALDRLFE